MLVAHGLTKSFGAVKALQGVSLSLAHGEVRAICGENGAGKSTLLKILMGIVRPDAGSIEIDGAVQAIHSPQRAQQLGLALMSQELSLAPDLSILDNIWLGHRAVPLFHRRREFRQRAADALKSLDASYELDTPVKELSLGQRQIIEIAKLLVRDARVLILDEPTATLSDIEIERLMAALRRLKAQGKSVLYVTHRLGEVFAVCDSVSVLRNGLQVGSYSLANITRDQLINAMLGRPLQDMYPQRVDRADAAEGLVVSQLRIPGLVEDFSAMLPRGKITCIAGQVGAGATAVTRSLAGLLPDATGRVVLDGRPIKLGSIRDRLAHDITFVSEDRASEGLFRRPVVENLVASRLSDCVDFGKLSWHAVRRLARSLCDALQIDGRRLQTDAFNLSGGNQQKVLFSRAFSEGRRGVLLINEPTRGVDVGARADIYRILRRLCDQGYVLLVTSTDLEEVVGIADRVVTMYRGRIVAQYERAQLDSATILADLTHPAR